MGSFTERGKAICRPLQDLVRAVEASLCLTALSPQARALGELEWLLREADAIGSQATAMVADHAACEREPSRLRAEFEQERSGLHEQLRDLRAQVQQLKGQVKLGAEKAARMEVDLNQARAHAKAAKAGADQLRAALDKATKLLRSRP